MMACYLFAYVDGKPRYYLNDDGDCAYDLGGKPAFYLNDFNAFSYDGRRLYYVAEGCLCDATGPVLYFDQDEAPQTLLEKPRESPASGTIEQEISMLRSGRRTPPR
jgi:hypothetical protein